MFSVIDDEFCILRSKGVYRQARVYQRAGALYASYGAGFIRLCRGGGTSAPSVSWEEVSVQHSADRLGRLVVKEAGDGQC